MVISKQFVTFASMTGKEAAGYLGIHRSALCLMVKDGLIRVTPDPNHAQRFIYNKEDVESVAEARRKTSGTNTSSTNLNPDEIVRKLGFNLEELKSPCRFRRVVDHRRIVASVLTYIGYTLIDIGNFLNRNHSTVINLLNSSYLVEDEVLLAIQKVTGESTEDTNR